jgi:hypothetical protein
MKHNTQKIEPWHRVDANALNWFGFLPVTIRSIYQNVKDHESQLTYCQNNSKSKVLQQALGIWEERKNAFPQKNITEQTIPALSTAATEVGTECYSDVLREFTVVYMVTSTVIKKKKLWEITTSLLASLYTLPESASAGVQYFLCAQ